MWLFILTNLNPLHPGMLCAKCYWNWSNGSGEEEENMKIYEDNEYKDDDGQIVIRKAHLILLLRWAKKH